MNEETVFPTEVQDSIPTEPVAVETESPDTETTAPIVAETEPETLPSITEPEESIPDTVVIIPDATDDYYWDTLPDEDDPVEIIEETIAEVVEIIDYTPAIGEATSIVANIILCGALMIVGVLTGIRLWR